MAKHARPHAKTIGKAAAVAGIAALALAPTTAMAADGHSGSPAGADVRDDAHEPQAGHATAQRDGQDKARQDDTQAGHGKQAGNNKQAGHGKRNGHGKQDGKYAAGQDRTDAQAAGDTGREATVPPADQDAATAGDSGTTGKKSGDHASDRTAADGTRTSPADYPRPGTGEPARPAAQDPSRAGDDETLVAEKLRHQGMVQIDVKDDLPVYAYNGRALVDGVGLWPLAEHDGMYAVMFQGRVVGWMVPPVETTGATGDGSGTAADEDAATITDPQKMGHILHQRGLTQIDTKDDLPVYAYNGRALVDGLGLWPLAEHDGMYALMYHGRVVGWMVPPVETTGATGDGSGTAADEDAATITDPQKMGHILHQRGLTQIDTKDNLPVFANNPKAMTDGLGLWPLPDHDGMYAVMYQGHVVGWMVPLPDAAEPAVGHAGDTGTDTHGGKDAEGGKDSKGHSGSGHVVAPAHDTRTPADDARPGSGAVGRQDQEAAGTQLAHTGADGLTGIGAAAAAALAGGVAATAYGTRRRAANRTNGN
ncbi:hypothetical protein AB0B59_35760 [Streptomyces huasconensis]|uniref:hypothetical protein n=2 Tax=Streptomyces huasconensis TaxID=1854574 RepID=UPI0033F85CBD